MPKSVTVSQLGIQSYKCARQHYFKRDFFVCLFSFLSYCAMTVDIGTVLPSHGVFNKKYCPFWAFFFKKLIRNRWSCLEILFLCLRDGLALRSLDKNLYRLIESAFLMAKLDWSRARVMYIAINRDTLQQFKVNVLPTKLLGGNALL